MTKFVVISVQSPKRILDLAECTTAQGAAEMMKELAVDGWDSLKVVERNTKINGR